MIRAALIALLASACFVNTDDIEERANQRSDSVDVEEFGIDVVGLPLAPDEIANQQLLGVRFVVAGHDPFTLTTIYYDQGGLLPSINVAEPGGPPVQLVHQPAALVPGVHGAFAISDPPRQQVRLMVTEAFEPPMEIDLLDPEVCGMMPQSLPGFGRDVVIARTNDSGMNEPEVIVMSDQGLTLFSDFEGTDGAACTNTCSINQPVAVVEGNFDADQATQEIAVAHRIGNDVVVTITDGVTVAGSPDCFVETPVISDLPPEFDPRLFIAATLDPMPGRAADIITVNPNDGELRVYRDPHNNPDVPPQRLLDPRFFGATSLVVGDFEETPGLEILIGVPIDELGADDGRVYGVSATGPPNAPLEVIFELRDSSTEDDQQYGRSIANGRFQIAPNASVDLPIVGANGEVFTVFQPGGGREDPRF